MALLIQSLGCPNCGAPYEDNTRNCGFCGFALIVTSLNNKFGRRSIESHQISESLAKWRKQIKENRYDAAAHFALGLSYLNAKLRDSALVEFRKAAELTPEMADVHYTLAVTLFNDGDPQNKFDYEEVQKELKLSIQLTPDFPEALAFNHYFMANKLKDLGCRQAIVEFQKAIGFCPDIAFWHCSLGDCFVDTNKYAEAEASYQRAIELEPNDYLYYDRMCHLKYVMKEYAGGVEFGMKAISLNNNEEAGIYHDVALCLFELNKLPEAYEHAFKAVALDDDVEEYKETLNSCLEEFASRLWTQDGSPQPIEKIPEVIEYFNKSPKSPDVKKAFYEYFKALGQNLWKSKRTFEAINCLNKSIELNPDNKDSNLMLSVLYSDLSVDLWKLSNSQEAIRYIEKAIAICPDDVLYKNNLKTYQSNKWLQRLKIKRAYAFNDNLKHDRTRLLEKTSNNKINRIFIIIPVLAMVLASLNHATDQAKNISSAIDVSQPNLSANNSGRQNNAKNSSSPVSGVINKTSLETAKPMQDNTESATKTPYHAVGDTYTTEILNPADSNARYVTERKIISVDLGKIVVESKYLSSKKHSVRTIEFTHDWNLIKSINANGEELIYSPYLKYFDFPLYTGKTWKQTSTEINNKTGLQRKHTLSGTVEDWETVTVPAGTFKALKIVIKAELFDPANGQRSIGIDNSWYVPELRRSVKSETTSQKDNGSEGRQNIQIINYSLN